MSSEVTRPSDSGSSGSKEPYPVAPLDSVPMPFLIMSGLFVAALVTSNLITNKFVTVDFGFHSFELPAGILPYPITFLVTDLLSEVYGRRRANQVVTASFFSIPFVILAIELGKHFDATSFSTVDNETFNVVFGNGPRLLIGSMVAYLVAQFIDIRLFHFWKDLTKGRHLWLRNNASTMVSQLVDSSIVICILFVGVDAMPDEPGHQAHDLIAMILTAWSFKLVFAAIDTPFAYLGVWLFRRYAPTPELLRRG
ncbi:MAG: queuosine precursor transporter [Planctomycetota bacterium]